MLIGGTRLCYGNAHVDRLSVGLMLMTSLSFVFPLHNTTDNQTVLLLV